MPALRILVLAAVIALCAPAAASAGGWAPTPAMTATAHQIAAAHWGFDACGGQVDEYWTHLGRGRNAVSDSWAYDAHNPSTYTGCSVRYSYDVGWDWPKYCTIVMHERGHLTGHDHVDFKWNVMYVYYEAPAVECTRPQPWYQPPAKHARAASRRRAHPDPASR